jgi:hypothetical protein
MTPLGVFRDVGPEQRAAETMRALIDVNAETAAVVL